MKPKPFAHFTRLSSSFPKRKHSPPVNTTTRMVGKIVACSMYLYRFGIGMDSVRCGLQVKQQWSQAAVHRLVTRSDSVCGVTIITGLLVKRRWDRWLPRGTPTHTGKWPVMIVTPHTLSLLV